MGRAQARLSALDLQLWHLDSSSSTSELTQARSGVDVCQLLLSTCTKLYDAQSVWWRLQLVSYKVECVTARVRTLK